MKKVFISLPMNGLDDEEIQDDIKCLQNYILGVFANDNEEVDFIDGFITEQPSDDVNQAAWFLGRSIQLLSKADLVVFAPGWQDARGCIIEHMVCALYGIPYAEVNPDVFFEIDDAFDDVYDQTHDWDLAGRLNAEISDAVAEVSGMKDDFEDALGFEHDYVDDLTQFDDEDIDKLEPGEYDADA